MIADKLYAHAATQPLHPFVAFGEREIGYGEMAGLVDMAADRFAGLGVRTGDRVALICGNRPGFLVCWLALSELGAITVPLNPALVGDGLRFALSQSETSLLVAEPEILETHRETLDAFSPSIATVLLDGDLESGDAHPQPRKRLSLPPGTPNAILYTSGTTGVPKGVVVPNASYEIAGEHMSAALEIGPEDRIMVFLPLFHANPQMYAVMSALETGATLILLPRFSAATFFDDARRTRATGFTFVGTVLAILCKRVEGRQRGHALRWGVGGGAPRAVWAEVEERFGIPVRELYGMTETGGWVSLNTAGASRLGSVGRIRPETEVAIVDDGDRSLPPGEKGEIVVRARRPFMMFDGYWRNPEATVAATRNLWIHTGDRGFLDADGYLHFEGRLKELIRRAGEMISPVEIELQVLKLEGVRDCAAVGVPDEIMGEEVKVAIVAGEGFDAARLAERLSAHLPAHALPRYVELVDTIPKTPTQKIQRHLLATVTAGTLDLKRRAEAPLGSARKE